MGGVKNHFPESPVYRVYPLYIQADSVKRFLTPSLILLSPCAVFVFNSAFVFFLTWLFLGCHPRQWLGARPSAPAYRAPSRPSPATKGSTFCRRKFSTEEKSKVGRISPPRTAIGQLWSRSPLTWRSPNIHTTWAPERLKWFFKWQNGCKSGHHPPTHSLTSPAGRAHTISFSASELWFSFSTRIIRGQKTAAAGRTFRL